jgi:glucose dehydrogenase
VVRRLRWLRARAACAFAAIFAICPLGASAASPPSAAASAPSGDWPVVGHDAQNTRFSPLDQITTANVASLKLSFSFATGIPKGHEAAPLVIDDTMYVVTPYPNTVYAFDLRQPNVAAVKWKFEPDPNASSQGVACCDVVNRGLAYADGRVFVNTLDAQTIALDAASGR